MAASSVQMFANIGITVTIDFGHKDANGACVERGLCRISVGGTKAITASVNDNTGVLELTFAKSAIPRNVYDLQFINGLFEVPVAYSLTPEVCAKLGINSYTVKAGRYKVIETDKQYKIVFTK